MDTADQRPEQENLNDRQGAEPGGMSLVPGDPEPEVLWGSCAPGQAVKGPGPGWIIEEYLRISFPH